MSAEFDDVLTNQPVVIDNVCHREVSQYNPSSFYAFRVPEP